MPQPLLDRMEIIRLPGYTEDEKVEIATQHLIPKQIEANGLKEGEVDITDDAVRDLIRYYTREAGVRNLEREIANLARKARQGDPHEGDVQGEDHAPRTSTSMPACAASATARPSSRIRSASSPAWPGPRSAASC